MKHQIRSLSAQKEMVSTVTAFAWVKDLLREVPENADAPVQYFISVVIISQELILSSGSQVVKGCSYW